LIEPLAPQMAALPVLPFITQRRVGICSAAGASGAESAVDAVEARRADRAITPKTP